MMRVRSIAHNVADSLGSGIGMLVGVYDLDVFAEAQRAPGGVISIDFLAASATRGKVSRTLARAITKYHEALPDLCAKHGASIEEFKTLTASYSADAISRRIIVRVRDGSGRCCVDEYIGTPARQVKVADRLGRIRTKRRGSRSLKTVE
jgi:hypothetical protein